MKQADSERLWAERIAGWKASGLKQRAFADHSEWKWLIELIVAALVRLGHDA